MVGLTLRLLGVPEIVEDSQAVTGFRSVKARALLFYVAVSGQPQARTKLAGLLWGELPDTNANANLRKTLTNLRRVVGPYLTITRHTVALNDANPPWLDVRAFETALQSNNPGDWQTAVNLYRGDFLEGFYVDGTPEFETWLLTQRYRLREQVQAALQKLARHHAGRRQFAEAIDHGQHLLALEPLREDVHRLLMTLFAQSGQRARALTQYETCTQILAEELGVEPGEKTTMLFSQIQDGTFVSALPVVSEASVPAHNLPAPTTSFVGRDQELLHVNDWLADANGRLLTITGPGGVGKTRLALQVAWDVAWDAAHGFSDGVWVVPLASLADVGGLATAVAAALGITFFGKADPVIQVIRYLRRKKLLLVLDNAEPLLSQAFADFLLEILTQAPAVKLIVTSRQRLQMQAERLLDLPGLAYPVDDTTISGSSYPAGRLFVQRAENHGVRLAASPETDTVVYQLCRLVDGLPLALEMAATWTSAVSLADIVTEIERGLDLLKTNMRDVPSRHRSIRAVFDTSWQMLAEEERRLMRRLAYFRGGFSVEAANNVVGASLSQLQDLVSKSFIRPQGQDRYDMHELIRQYAAGKLAQHPDEAAALARRHGQYFTHFLSTREATIQGTDYLQAKTEIKADIDNVRKAWEWAVATPSLADMERAFETLHYYFFNTQGLFSEAAQRFQQAAEQAIGTGNRDAEPLAARLWVRAAVNLRMMGQLEAAESLLSRSLDIFHRHEQTVDIARATSTLGVIKSWQQDKEAALHLTKKAVAIMRELDLPVDLCLCLNNMAHVLGNNGENEAAIAALTESSELSQAIGYPHGTLSAMNMMGVYYKSLDELEKAEAIFEELVARCRGAATESRLAQAVNNLGALYKQQGKLAKAHPYLQEAVRLYEAVGQIHYAAFVTVMLGEISVARGDLDRARRSYRQGLETAREIEMPSLALSALSLLGHLLSAQGEDTRAVSVLAFVAHHPATLVDVKDEVRLALQELEARIPAQDFTTARERGEAWTLEEIIVEKSRPTWAGI